MRAETPKPPDAAGGLRRLGAGRTPRERWALAAAALALVLGLVIGLGVMPAVRTLRAVEAAEPPAQHTVSQLLALRDEARLLQARAQPAPGDALRVVERLARERLGGDTLVQGGNGRVNVVFRGARADAVATWLAQVRAQTQAWPVEARLSRAAAGAAAGIAAPAAAGSGGPAAPSGGGVSWDGAVLLQFAAPAAAPVR